MYLISAFFIAAVFFTFGAKRHIIIFSLISIDLISMNFINE